MAGLCAAPIRAPRHRQDATTSLQLPGQSYADETLDATRSRFQSSNAPRFSAARRISTIRSDNSGGAPLRIHEFDDTTTHLELPNRVRPQVATRRPVSAILADRLAAQAAREREEATARGLAGKREARRRTIYVPEDTTIMTIHPASSLSSNESADRTIKMQHRPVRRGSVLQKPKRRSSMMPMVEEALDLTGVIPLAQNQEMDAVTEVIEEVEEVAPLPSRPVSKSSYAPRRKSLAFMARERQKVAAQVPSLEPLQEGVSRVRPKLRERRSSSSTSARKALKALNSANGNHRITKQRITPSLKASILEQKRLQAQKTSFRVSIAPSLERTLSDENVLFVVGKPKPISVSDGSMLSSIHETALAKPNPTKFEVSTGRAVSDPAEFAIVKDDIAHPELYEENWLEHHEIALTQLLNAFFETAHLKHKQKFSFNALRSRFMTLHNDPEIPHLQKRIQASLMYGSLKVPEEVLARSLRLKDDLGQRRKFLNLFLDTYDLTMLQAAAEVIAGREFVLRKRTPTESMSAQDIALHGDRKSIEQYLDHFFVHHADVPIAKTNSTTISALARDKVDQVGSPIWAWRRTVTKSLMLLLLLDKAKQEQIVPGCLFQTTSNFKTSEAVVKALGSMLLPSYGDLMRPLKHLKYEVFVEQQPIQEFDYHVDNIATDLRDGIRLTRTVEILLSDSHKASVISNGAQHMWNLSQHLKYPCPGRSHKLQNVMAALSAMVRLPSMPETLLKEITAYDIVDGHREKTLSLLWAMLGQYAMESLVDWNLVRKETNAAQDKLSRAGRYTAAMEDISEVQATSKSKCWGMLYQWSMAVAALQDVTITNLTTSFAGQAAFRAILQTYLPYLPTKSNEPVVFNTLESSLKAAGCSTAFIRLLSTPHSIIPTRDFTLTSLTFLAARLLPATRTHRAACTIQRSWRLLLCKRAITSRVKLMRLASHCAAVVQARDRVIGAAVVLQRAWRRVLDCRIGRLEREVCAVQCLARAWLLRKDMAQQQQHQKRGIVEIARERRAGW